MPVLMLAVLVFRTGPAGSTWYCYRWTDRIVLSCRYTYSAVIIPINVEEEESSEAADKDLTAVAIGDRKIKSKRKTTNGFLNDSALTVLCLIGLESPIC